MDRRYHSFSLPTPIEALQVSAHQPSRILQRLVLHTQNPTFDKKVTLGAVFMEAD